MARSSTASLLLALCCSFAMAAPGCGGTVSDSPASDGGAGTTGTSGAGGTGGSGPSIVKGGAGGMGGSQTGGSGTSSKGGGPAAGTGGGGGTTGKGGTGGKGGKGGTGTGGSADLFDLDVPPEAEPCYECVKDECKDQLTECNNDPQCVAVATCLLDQCATNQSTQCAIGCLEDNGLSLTDFNNPVVQTAIGIGQCAQNGCPDECQGAGMGMGGTGSGKGGGPGKGGSSGKGGGPGKGGSSGKGGSAGGGGGPACSFIACGQACGQIGLKCSQDAECSACAQNPSGAGCDANAAFQDSKQCCNDNVAVCGGCQTCSALIGSGTGGTGAGGDGGTAGTGAGGDGTAGTGAGGDGSGGTGAGGTGAGGDQGSAGTGAGGEGGTGQGGSTLETRARSTPHGASIERQS